MHKLMLIIITVHYSIIKAQQSQQCGNWVPYKDEKCFLVLDNNNVNNYTAALTKCKQLYNDLSTTLVTIHSEEEQQYLVNLIFNVNKIVNDVWIGADYKNKYLNWSDNVNENYTNFANGYPNDVTGAECVSLGFDNPNHGKWLNDPCGKTNSVVCQRQQVWISTYLQNTVMEMRKNSSKNVDLTNRVLQNTLTELNDYNSDLKRILTNASTGCTNNEIWIKCSLFSDFHTNQRKVIAIAKALNEKILTRNNAINVCKKYNATLVSVESAEKQLFIENFVQSNVTRVWTSGYNSEDKIWRWINGQEIKYSNWNLTQPDNGYPKEPCLEIFGNDLNYKWNDCPCDEEHLVVCEF